MDDQAVQLPTAGIAEATAQAASVGKGGSADAPGMAKALANAFFDDPVFTWVLSGDPNRMPMLERGFGLFLRRVWLEQEETYTTDAKAGVAVWLLPGRWNPGIWRQLLLLPAMISVFKRRLPRVLRALTTLEMSHPHELHYYLAFVGVDPSWQGRGIGSAVLRPVLERCDSDGTPAFLEASTPRSRALYERHGFEVTEEFKLGRDAPPQWRMWRKPQPAAV